MPRPLVTVTRGLHDGQIGWLLRWREHTIPSAPRRLCYWFADHEEAVIVRDAMRAGESFEVAFRRVWTA